MLQLSEFETCTMFSEYGSLNVPHDLFDLRKSWHSEVITNANFVYINLVVFVLLRLVF